MCGILVYFGKEELTVDHPGLVSIAHRGPDGAGIQTFRVNDYFLSLGHRRLSIIDLSENAAQPMCYQDSRLWITYNVETDNFDFKSNNFDIVLSIEVLEHLMSPDRYLSEIFRVTKNEGLVLMTIPNILSLISRIRVIFGLFPMAVTDKTHVGFYRKKDVVKLLASYNMRPQFIPTSISLNPLNRKSWFSIPSVKLISSLDDSFLFLIRIEK